MTKGSVKNIVEFSEIKDHRTENAEISLQELLMSGFGLFSLKDPSLLAFDARWKTENETFNTLKNQGYHFEHNFGHGQQHLSVIFANLMMLAFLVDQIQEAACLLFQAALAKVGSKIRLWEKMRAYFLSIHFSTIICNSQPWGGNCCRFTDLPLYRL